MGLNQDLQDFEDFYLRGVGWDGACRSSKCKINYPPFHFADAIIAAAKYLDRDTFPISTILTSDVICNPVNPDSKLIVGKCKKYLSS